ncbi:AMP-binding protein [Brevibacterium luteolum]|uniref:AMP-binding protein n=1 Tax=Brevibacterium luteolum TaxID=199591 RepID=UPI003B671919
MCASALAADPDAVVIHAFDRTWTYAEVDAEAHRLARALAGAGVAAGDRVALFVQNDPIFVTGLLAAWKLGAIGVPINPMNTGLELAFQLEDSAAVALIALPGLWTQVAQQVVADGIGDVRLAILAPHTAWRQGGWSSCTVTGRNWHRTPRGGRTGSSSRHLQSPCRPSCSAVSAPPRSYLLMLSHTGRTTRQVRSAQMMSRC